MFTCLHVCMYMCERGFSLKAWQRSSQCRAVSTGGGQTLVGSVQVRMKHSSSLLQVTVLLLFLLRGSSCWVDAPLQPGLLSFTALHLWTFHPGGSGHVPTDWAAGTSSYRWWQGHKEEKTKLEKNQSGGIKPHRASQQLFSYFIDTVKFIKQLRPRRPLCVCVCDNFSNQNIPATSNKLKTTMTAQLEHNKLQTVQADQPAGETS